jgi:hypothetical protein
MRVLKSAQIVWANPADVKSLPPWRGLPRSARAEARSRADPVRSRTKGRPCRSRGDEGGDDRGGRLARGAEAERLGRLRVEAGDYKGRTWSGCASWIHTPEIHRPEKRAMRSPRSQKKAAARIVGLPQKALRRAHFM